MAPATKLVELTGPRDLLDHVGEFGRPIDGIGEILRLHDELRIFDLVEVPGAVRQLHARLERPVALASQRRFPDSGSVVQAFDGKRLAPGPPRGRHGGQGRVAGNQPFQCDGRNDIDQGIQTRFALGLRQRQTAQGPVESGLPALLLDRSTRHFRRACVGLRLLRRIAARSPGAVSHQGGQHHAASNGQTDLE